MPEPPPRYSARQSASAPRRVLVLAIALRIAPVLKNGRALPPGFAGRAQQQPRPGQAGRSRHLSHLPGHLRILAGPAWREPLQGAAAPRAFDPDDDAEIRQARA